LPSARCKQASSTTGTPGFNAKGKKTLAHPEYRLIQAWWHPDLNQGNQPADFTFGSNKIVWLRCHGCAHGCGRVHEWEAKICNLTQNGGQIVCPDCDSRGRHGFCECQSAAADPRLSKEWHPDNPTPANKVARNSNTKHRWLCPQGHAPYVATCSNRCTGNTGCPECFKERKGKVWHESVSEGRTDLAAEWDHKRNTKLPEDVTLGSNYNAWWGCSRDREHLGWQTRVFDRALKGKGCPVCGLKNRGKPRLFGAGSW